MFNSWLDFSAFMPHGFCLRWDPALLATMIVANLMIAVAYFSIPSALFFFVRKRKDLVFPWMFQLFGLFIISCGTTHLVKILTIYKAAYWWEAGVDLFTGVVSMVTAVLLWPLIPKALNLPSPTQLERANKQLLDSMNETKKLNEELQSINDQFRVARDQAIESSNLKSGFVATISHELRTPLTGILGLNELLMSTKLDDEQQALSKSINEAADSLLAIVNDILDLSKLEAGRLQVDLAPLNLRQLINECLDIVSTPASRKGLALKSSMDPELMNDSLFGDSVRIKQILTNLLGNAVKFTEKGEVELRAEFVGAAEESIIARFVVRDTGIGIDTKSIDRIFMPFTQADQSTSRKYGGTGLGLSICRYLSELVGGQITVKSEEGKGSSFSLELPLMKSANVRQILTASGSLKPALVSNVLVVEDDPFLQQLAGKQMQRLGVSARVARGADEALEFLKSEAFDVIFMDCHMPGTDGYALTGMIRASQDWRHIPIVAMTAGAMVGDYERCISSGMDDYLSKPYTLKQLEGMLRKWTGQVSVSEKNSTQSTEAAAASSGTTEIPDPDPASIVAAAEPTIANSDSGSASIEIAAVAETTDSADKPPNSDGTTIGDRLPADLEKLRTTYGDSACEEILDLFFQSSQTLLVELRDATAAKSASAVKELSHRLKGSCLMAFMDPLSQMSARIEKEAREAQPDWNIIDQDLRALIVMLDDVAGHCSRPRITGPSNGVES